MLGEDVCHFMGEYRRQFGCVAGKRDQSARDIKLSGGKSEGVHRAGIQDCHFIGEIGPLGCRDKTIDRLGDQSFQPRVVIGAAIGRQDAAVLALGGRCLGRRLVRFDRHEAGAGGSLEPAEVAAGTERQGRTKNRRRDNAARFLRVFLARKCCHASICPLLQAPLPLLPGSPA